MGILHSGKKLLDIAFKAGNFQISKTEMFEFGDQAGMHGALDNQVSKIYFENLGIKRYVSVDLNGQNGALKRDMTKAVKDLGKFDIVTNFGSIEHVEPLKNQYKCFKNINTLCKVGGFMIHHLPPVGHWIEHSPAHYTQKFFEVLIKKNGYLCHFYEHVDEIQLIGCVLQKTKEGFMTEKDFPYKEIEWNTDKEYPRFEHTW